MNHFIVAIGAGVLIGAGVALAPFPAFAARCDGDFELVRGSWVSTPYCRAVQIAEVARESGMQDVSAAKLLRHRAFAEEVCRFLHSDIRVHPACEELHPLVEWSW